MGIFLLGAPLSQFNGGRSQTAMNFLGYGADYPFINVMKTNQGWSGTADQLDPRNYDTNGYPVSLTGQILTIMYVPNSTRRPGKWVVTWDSVGTTTIGVSGFAVTDETGSKTTTGATGRYGFRPAAGTNQFTISISNITAPNKISNVQVFHENDEIDLLNGEIYTADFRNKLIEMNPGVLRHGDWLPMNTTQVTTWATRRPTSYYTFAGIGEMRSSMCVGITSGGTGDNYEITTGTGVPVDKQTIIIRFDRNAVGTQPTLNIDGTGAIPIAIKTSANANGLTDRRISIDKWATMVYDADLNEWIRMGADSAGIGNAFLENGVPPEIFMRLCRDVGAHPWWNAPMFACDPMTDYMTELATYCRDQGESWMIPRFEGPNETWNTANNNFHNGFYANNKQRVWNGGPTPYGTDDPFEVTNIAYTGTGSTGNATLTITGTLPRLGARLTMSSGNWNNNFGWNGVTAYVVARDTGANTITMSQAPTGSSTNPTAVTATCTSSSADLMNWYGRVMSNIGQNINTVYGSPDVRTQTDYQVIIGVQTAAAGNANTLPRIGATSYSISEGTNSTPDLSVAAYNWCTHIAVATYMSPTAYGFPSELHMAYRYAQGDSAVADEYCDTLNGSFGGNFGLSQTATLFASNFAACQNWGGVSGNVQAPFANGGGTVDLKMTAYEGGYSPDFTTGMSPAAAAVTSPISAATKAANCVLTLNTTTIISVSRSGPGVDAASVTAGAQLSFTGFPTGWTALNSGRYLVLGVSGNDVTIQFDSSGIVEAFSGTPIATYVGPAASTQFGANATASRMMDELRNAGRFSTHLTGYTYGGYLGSNSNYQNFLDAGGEFPSQFFFSAPATNPAETTPVGTGTAWGMLTNIYDPPSAAFDGIKTFNNE